MVSEVRIIGIQGIPEVRQGDDLGLLITHAAEAQGVPVQDDDILVVTQKIVSKAEGRLVDLRDIEPSEFAQQVARENDRDPRMVEVVLRESRRIVKMGHGVIITETHQGLICANAGVDASNVPQEGVVALLPLAPDRSAEEIRRRVRELTGMEVAVIISDTFGRPWREGTTEVAVGVAGLNPVKDYRGAYDPYGHRLRVTVVAVADELACAAELVTGKMRGVPVAIVRGYMHERQQGSAGALLRDPSTDLFR